MYDVILAEHLEDYKIKLQFSDNSEGTVDFFEYTKRKGLFSELRNFDYFLRFKLDEDLKTIVWDNGLDIAPDTLYIKATGRYPDGLS